MILWKPDN